MIAPGTDLLIRAVMPWEIAMKLRVGKWPGAEAILTDLDAALVDRLTALPITLAHARRVGLLPSPHKDPFDRMLTAQRRSRAPRSSRPIQSSPRCGRAWCGSPGLRPRSRALRTFL